MVIYIHETEHVRVLKLTENQNSVWQQQPPFHLSWVFGSPLDWLKARSRLPS
jgi:hypothetical protein